MKLAPCLLLLFLLMTQTTLGLAQTGQDSASAPVVILQNKDILRLVRQRTAPDEIVKLIRSSYCNFDVFPPVLQDLNRRGVPAAVLRAMVAAPNGPPGSGAVNGLTNLTIKVQIPQNTPVELEAAYPVSSADLEEGNHITFLVRRPLYIDGALAVARGAVATARVTKNKPAESWGRAGNLSWQMEDVVAVDGTRIPLRFADEVKGSSRAATLAAGAAITSAIIFPYTSPVALVWGFKKGEDAVVRGSTPITAVVGSDTSVEAIVPRGDEPIYHYASTINANQNQRPARQSRSATRRGVGIGLRRPN